MSTVEERLRRFLIDNYKLDPAQLTPDAPLASLGIDSLGMVELLFMIEDEFKVKLPADTEVLPTLGAAVRCVEQLLASSSAAAIVEPTAMALFTTEPAPTAPSISPTTASPPAPP